MAPGRRIIRVRRYYDFAPRLRAKTSARRKAVAASPG
jgi:hypothetical protein